MVSKFGMEIEEAVAEMGKMKRAGFTTSTMSSTFDAIDKIGGMAGMSTPESMGVAIGAANRAHSMGMYGQSAAIQSVKESTPSTVVEIEEYCCSGVVATPSLSNSAKKFVHAITILLSGLIDIDGIPPSPVANKKGIFEYPLLSFNTFTFA